MRIGLLLGAGASIPAGIPSTRQMTDQVLSGAGVTRWTDGKYYVGEATSPADGLSTEYVPRVVALLKRLKSEIDQYYVRTTDRVTTYEDIYYVAYQIWTSEAGEYDNPAMGPFISKILSEMSSLFALDNGDLTQDWQLRDLADETTNYIGDLVHRLLYQEPRDLDHLNCIADVCLDSESPKADIFTLNHDCVLERSLARYGISTNDGFGALDPKVDARCWDPQKLEEETPRVRLLKLHGSVNWFPIQVGNGGFVREIVGVPSQMDYLRGPSTWTRQFPIDARPMLLIGTFNKILQYASGIFTDLYWHFHSSLQRIQRIIVIGYGFGDKAINTQLLEWLFSSADHRLIIVNPNPDELEHTARFAIIKNLVELKKRNQWLTIARGVEAISWREIKDRL